jgi:hypothetical protein
LLSDVFFGAYMKMEEEKNGGSTGLKRKNGVNE